MKLHILVEGTSDKELLDRWLPRFIPQHSFNVLRHWGKGRLPQNPEQPPDPRRQGLLDQLPAKLRAFGSAFNPETDRILVLVDQDEDSCIELKQRLLRVLDSCDPKPDVLFRIATRETEAFYLGEPTAIKRAFPKARLGKLSDYHPDIHPEEGTWELFCKVIGEETEDKVRWAEMMGNQLDITKPFCRKNKSLCYRHFCRAILQLVGEPYE